MKPTALPLALLTAALLLSQHLVPAAAAENKTETKKTEAKKAKVNKPADRVVVMYFHRTQRCPTCLKMGAYSEEAVLKEFTRQIKNGTVEFHYVDFQDPRNAALTKASRVAGPTLIVAKIVKNKVVAAKSLKEIWTRNRDKDLFFKYVQDHVAAYRKPASKTALKPRSGTPTGKSK